MTTNFASPQDLLGAVGSDLGVTDWVTITQDQIDKFADATLDNQWIHVDTERAKGELLDAKEVPGGVQATVRITMEREGGDKPVAIVDSISRYLA
jgi:hypothetical protein